MLTIAALAVFPLLMAYAAASDLLTMTISNRVSLTLVASFAVLAVLTGMDWRVVLMDHALCGLAVLVITFVFFAFGWIGGGDAKLAASTALWIGWPNLYDYGFEASVFGAVLTLGLLAFRDYHLPPSLSGREWIARLHTAGGGVPYGIALAAAGLMIYPETTLWRAASLA